MSATTARRRRISNLAELIEGLGGLPLERVRFHPFPGTARARHALNPPGEQGRLCELVDGVLVEKAMGAYESRVASLVAHYLESYLEQHDLGAVFGADVMLALGPGLVRMPDVAYLSWDRFPNRLMPADAIYSLPPDLAVEVLSAGNTEAEMARKVGEYFAAGCRVVWLIDPASGRASIHRDAATPVQVSLEGELEAEEVLPGLRIPLARLFERAGRRAAEP
jgi:Uma2 family endonuclease